MSAKLRYLNAVNSTPNSLSRGDYDTSRRKSTRNETSNVVFADVNVIQSSESLSPQASLSPKYPIVREIHGDPVGLAGNVSTNKIVDQNIYKLTAHKYNEISETSSKTQLSDKQQLGPLSDVSAGKVTNHIIEKRSHMLSDLDISSSQLKQQNQDRNERKDNPRGIALKTEVRFETVGEEGIKLMSPTDTTKQNVTAVLVSNKKNTNPNKEIGNLVKSALLNLPPPPPPPGRPPSLVLRADLGSNKKAVKVHPDDPSYSKQINLKNLHRQSDEASAIQHTPNTIKGKSTGHGEIKSQQIEEETFCQRQHSVVGKIHSSPTNDSSIRVAHGSVHRAQHRPGSSLHTQSDKASPALPPALVLLARTANNNKGTTGPSGSSDNKLKPVLLAQTNVGHFDRQSHESNAIQPTSIFKIKDNRAEHREAKSQLIERPLSHEQEHESLVERSSPTDDCSIRVAQGSVRVAQRAPGPILRPQDDEASPALPSALKLLSPVVSSKYTRKGQIDFDTNSIKPFLLTQSILDRKSNRETNQTMPNFKNQGKSEKYDEEGNLRQIEQPLSQEDNVPYSRRTIGSTVRADKVTFRPEFPRPYTLELSVQVSESKIAAKPYPGSGSKLNPTLSKQSNVEYLDRKNDDINFTKPSKNLTIQADSLLSTKIEYQGHESTAALIQSSTDDPSIVDSTESASSYRRTSIYNNIQENFTLSSSPLSISKETKLLLGGDEDKQKKSIQNHFLRPLPPPLIAQKSRASLSQDVMHKMRPAETSLRESYRNPSWEQTLDDSDIRRTQDMNEPFHFEESLENHKIQYHLEMSEQFQDTPDNNDAEILEIVDSSFRFQEASFYASQHNASPSDQSKMNTFVPFISENDRSRATAKESVAERRRKRARAALQASLSSDNATRSLNLNLPRKSLDDDTNRLVFPLARSSLIYSQASSSNQVSIAPISTFDGYSDEEESEENIALFSGGNTKSAPKRLLNMKNMIRRLPQASKTSTIQKTSAKIIRTSTVDKYAGKHSAEVVVDRSKLPISMQNTSPSLEVLSISSSNTRHQSAESDTLLVNEYLEKNDDEYSSGVKISARRNASLDSQSPTKQFYQYGSAGFDLYGMRDDETDLDVNDEEEEEEIISNDSSVSEMTNPTFFSQPESLLISRNSTGLNSQKIERGPTPSESESSVDQSESATPLIGGGNLSASHSSQEKGGEQATEENDHSDDNSERSDNMFILSAGDWNQGHHLSGKRISYDGFVEYSEQYSLADMDNDKRVMNDLFADPPLDCVEDDSDSEQSSKSDSISKFSMPLKKEVALDDMDENYLHLTVAAIRSARRQTKIEYDAKIKAIDLESEKIQRGSSFVNSDNAKEKNVNESDPDYSTLRSRPKLVNDLDRMDIAEVCSSGSIRHTPYMAVLESNKGTRQVDANRTWSNARRSYNTKDSHITDIFVLGNTPCVVADVHDISNNLAIKPFDEGELDDELCDIDKKRSSDSFSKMGDPITKIRRSSKHDPSNSSQAGCDRSITPLISSRQSAVPTSTSLSVSSKSDMLYQPSSNTRSQSDSLVTMDFITNQCASLATDQHRISVVSRASITIQSFFRRWLAELFRYRCIYAATKIQAVFRGWLSRDILADEHYCATLIQSHIRAYLATMFVYEGLYNVTIVQSLFRRKQALKEAQRRRSAISVIQRRGRSYKLRSKASILHVNATVIQASWRRFITHLTYQFTIVDIIIVQSVFRRRKALKLYNQMRIENIDINVTRIQSLWRSYSCSAKFVKTIVDVLIIQSLIRRWLVYRRVKRIKASETREFFSHCDNMLIASTDDAAKLIQKMWRGTKAQLAFVYDLVNIIISQSIIRRHLAIHRYQELAKGRRRSSVSHKSTAIVDFVEKTTAALTIQKIWRTFWKKIIDEEELNLCHEAAIIIQMYWRRFHHVKAYRTTAYKIRCIQNFIRSNVLLKRQIKVDHHAHYLALIEDIAFGSNDDDLLTLESCTFDSSEDFRQHSEPLDTKTVSVFLDHQKSGDASIVEDDFSSHLVHRPVAVNFQIRATSFPCPKETTKASGIAEAKSEDLHMPDCIILVPTEIDQECFDDVCQNKPSSNYLLHAVIRLQSLWRSYSCSAKFVKTIVDVLVIQSLIRRWLVYRRVKRIKASETREFYSHSDNMLLASTDDAAKLIQKVWRGRKAQLAFVYDLVNIIISQSIIRRHLAIHRYQELAKARRRSSVSHKSTAIVDFVEKTTATLTIQKIWRTFWKKIIDEEELNLCHEAAIIIQMYWRRFHHVKAYRTTAYKIRCIQNFIRSNVLLKRQIKVDHHAYDQVCMYVSDFNFPTDTYDDTTSFFDPRDNLLFSDHFRNTTKLVGVNIRQSCDDFEVSLHDDNLNGNVNGRLLVNAAIRIQSIWRSYCSHVMFTKMNFYVVIIQRLIRRWISIRRRDELFRENMVKYVESATILKEDISLVDHGKLDVTIIESSYSSEDCIEAHMYSWNSLKEPPDDDGLYDSYTSYTEVSDIETSTVMPGTQNEADDSKDIKMDTDNFAQSTLDGYDNDSLPQIGEKCNGYLSEELIEEMVADTKITETSEGSSIEAVLFGLENQDSYSVDAPHFINNVSEMHYYSDFGQTDI